LFQLHFPSEFLEWVASLIFFSLAIKVLLKHMKDPEISREKELESATDVMAITGPCVRLHHLHSFMTMGRAFVF
jgi:hypothetical protein